MKLKIIILILLFNCTLAQTYEKDWKVLSEKLDAGTPFTVKEGEAFAAKYNKSLAAYPDNSTQLYSVLANACYSNGDYKKAEENYLESYNYAVRAKDTSLKHIVELNLAMLNYNLGRLLEAEKYYLKCMAGMAAIYGQSSREYTGIFYDYTRLLVDLERYTDANPYVDALLYYYKTLDGESNVRYISLLNYKAIIYQNTGHYREAIDIYAKVVSDGALIKLGDTLGHVISIANLGDVYRETGQYIQAIHYLTEARSNYYTLNQRDKNTLASIENNLALCYKSAGDLKEAEDAYNTALTLYIASGSANSEPYCSVLSNKADLLRILGRYGEASDLLLDALRIRKENFGDKTENYANALSNLANVYFDAGSSYLDETYFKAALEKNLEAEAIYREAVGTEHQGYGNCMNNLSLCYLHFRNYREAEACKLKALSIIEKSVGKDHYRYAAYLISTYGLYRTIHQPDKAVQNMKEAMLLVERNFGKKHELYANAELALAEIHTLSGRYEEAGPLYFSCLSYYADQINGYFNAMSEADQLSFLNTISAAFESYNIYVINYKLSLTGKDLSQHVKLALKYQLLLKSLLANRSAQVRREIAASKDESLRQSYLEWLSLKNELINRYKSADAASEDNNALLKRISELEAKLKSKVRSFTQGNDISFEQLKERLAPDEAAIEIFKTRETLNDTQSIVKYGALILKKNSKEPELVIFREGDKLDGPGFAHYSTCIDALQKDTLSYGLYFRPFEVALQGIRKVYVSSDGVFNKISLAGLYEPFGKKYLAEEREFYQTSNLGSLSGGTAGAPGQALTASLFGYPDYDYDFRLKKLKPDAKSSQLVAKRYGLSNLAKLPGTKTEVEDIARELKGRNWQVNSFTEEQASEENLRKLHSPKVLHIATHGFYLKDVESEDRLFLGFENSMIRNNSLLRSGIILAGAGPATEDSTNRNSENDGILTAYEACLLDLSNTELVVLSACQTGLGDEMGTEGVAGLQRSLTIAGARHIIMSLWPVDDNATQQLMTEFYRTYAATQNVEQAFKTAQSAVRKKYPQPFYWAAFVLLKTFN